MCLASRQTERDEPLPRRPRWQNSYRPTARRWEVLEVAGHQDPRRRFERHLQKGTSSGSGGVLYQAAAVTWF